MPILRQHNQECQYFSNRTCSVCLGPTTQVLQTPMSYLHHTDQPKVISIVTPICGKQECEIQARNNIAEVITEITGMVEGVGMTTTDGGSSSGPGNGPSGESSLNNTGAPGSSSSSSFSSSAAAKNNANACNNCRKATSGVRKCAGCGKVAYCNRACERADMKSHGKVCDRKGKRVVEEEEKEEAG